MSVYVCTPENLGDECWVISLRQNFETRVVINSRIAANDFIAISDSLIIRLNDLYDTDVCTNQREVYV